MRCTCQQAVIEELEAVVRWIEDEFGDGWIAKTKAYEGEMIRDHIRELIAACRAKAPEREYKHQSYGWCPVCGHAGSESDHKCGE